MSEEGWIKVARGWQDSDVFGDAPYTDREAWLWMVGEANWKDSIIPIDGKPFTIHRGQFLSSVRFMAKKFQWSKDRVTRFLNKLKNFSMIRTETATGQTIITICNYSKYQDDEDTTKDTYKDSNKDGTKDTTKDKLEEGKEGEEDINTSQRAKAKISLEELSVDHVRIWLNAKRAIGKYLTVDEERLLEKFKDYCRAKGPKYKDLVAAFRNSFDWDNVPRKGERNGEITSRKPTKQDRINAALDSAVAEITVVDPPAARHPQITGPAELRNLQRLREGAGGAEVNPPRLFADP